MKRKRSAAVTLVLSGSLLVGCNDSSSSWGDSDTRTNNTYNPQYGYWHSHYGRWFPYPHNFYDVTRGYYYGGQWSTTPDPNPPTPRISSSSGGHYGGGVGTHSSGGVSRGGFGSSGHSGS